MEVFRFVLIGLAAALCALCIKGYRPELALALSIAAGILLLILALGKMEVLADFLRQISQQYGLNSQYIGVALKVAGIACITDLGAQLCKDAGEGAIAAKVELGGRLVLLLLAIPVVEDLLKMVNELMKL
jgi:stage III sporulation protein AD